MTTPNIDFTFDTFMPMQWVLYGDKNRTGGPQAMRISAGKREVDTDTRIHVMPGSYILQWDSTFPDGGYYRSFYFRTAGGSGSDDYFNFGTRATSGSQRITVPVESDLISYATFNIAYTATTYATQVISLIPVAPLASDVDKMNT